MGITIHQGDILTSSAEYLVNPANGHLNHGGGLAALIARKAGSAYTHGAAGEKEAVEQWHADHSAAPLIATGDAYLTSAGLLPFKGVIHAVGPIWGGGEFMERALLYRAHRSAVRVAKEAGATSIAFPAVSCGIFGFPVEKAAQQAILATAGCGLDVEFWLYEDAHYAAFQAALDPTYAAL